MKIVVLLLSLLVVGGTASAAIFTPSPEARPPGAKPAKISGVLHPAAAAVTDTGRSPVPLMRLPTAPAPQIASLTEPPADLSQLRPKPRSRETDAAKAAIQTDAAKAVIERGVTNDGRCTGRTLTSVTVEPNGRVHVQC